MEAKERTWLIKKNIVMALIVKVGSICCTMVLVPMTINFVNPIQYGIWLTISSVVTWMHFFDVGFSNGLRNKLTEALAQDRILQGRSYISTTYAMLTTIFGTLMALLLILIWTANLTELFGIEEVYEHDLKMAATTLVCYFCINMVVRTLSFVLMAKQHSAVSSLFDFLGQLLVLVCIWMLDGTIDGSLFVLSLALCIPPLMVWIIASIYLYASRYRQFCPNLSLVKMSDTKSLLNLGVKFFVIQIAYIIQFQTSTFLIGRLFSMLEVTSYNLAHRYFNVLYMVFFLSIEPLWSAVTDAWTNNDKAWIRHIVNKYLVLASICLIGGLLMLSISDWVYDIWINQHVDQLVEIPFKLSAWMFAYVGTTIMAQVFCQFVNGIGALRIQFCTSLISPIVFIAATLVMSKVLGMGMECVLIASILANFNGIILAPLQYWLVIYRNKKGIWTA